MWTILYNIYESDLFILDMEDLFACLSASS